jgi:hypothetical protein
MVVDIQQGVRYFELPNFNVTLDKTVHAFCFDVQKWNLACLMVPSTDTLGIQAMVGNPVTDAIQTYMDAKTRAALRLKPLEFIKYWNELHQAGTPYLASDCPEGYLAVMETRAQDAHERIFGIELVNTSFSWMKMDGEKKRRG